jgi:hypothetical protein
MARQLSAINRLSAVMGVVRPSSPATLARTMQYTVNMRATFQLCRAFHASAETYEASAYQPPVDYGKVSEHKRHPHLRLIMYILWMIIYRHLIRF